LGEATTFPLIVFSVASHGAYIQMAFLSRDSRVGVSKLRQMGFSRLWSPITLQADIGLQCGQKQSCSSCWKLSKGMLHALHSQVNRVDSWLFLVRNQIVNLTLDPSFGHNLCFRCPNEQCKPILDIYISRAFYILSLIFPHTFLHSQEYVMWLLSFFLVRTLVSPLLWLQAKG